VKGGLSLAYDGFISYSHAADRRLAPAVQAGLQQLARPWWRRRSLRIFRDVTGLAVSPHMWVSIAAALDDAEWFVLLASPESAQSPAVARELEHWFESKPVERVLPVVTDGIWRWDRDRDDFSADSAAVPPALRGKFREEPRHLNLRWARSETDLDLRNSRFRNAIADLAAPMHGIEKDELEGEDIRRHRQTMRLARGAATMLTLLFVVALAASGVAVINVRHARGEARRAARSEIAAERETRVARSRLLTVESRQALAEGKLDTALLLAVEAVRADDNPDSRTALFAPTTHLRGYLQGIESTRVITVSGDHKVIGAMSTDGRVMRWDGKTLRPLAAEPPPDPRAQVLALNRDGSLVATSRWAQCCETAPTAPTIDVWNARTRTRRTIHVDEGGSQSHAAGVSSIAFDPRLDRLAVVANGRVTIVDAQTGRAIRRLAWECDFGPSSHGCATAVAFDPLGTRLAVVSLRHENPADRSNNFVALISVWRMSDARLILRPTPTLTLGGGLVSYGSGLQVGLNGDTVWSSSVFGLDVPLRHPGAAESGSLAVRNARTGVVEPFGTFTGTVVAYDGSRTYAYRDPDGRLRLADLYASFDIGGLDEFDFPPATAFLDGRLLVGTRGRPIEVWDPSAYEPGRVDAVVSSSASGREFLLSDDGSTVFAVWPNGGVHSWRVGAAGVADDRTTPGLARYLFARARLSTDGRRLVTRTEQPSTSSNQLQSKIEIRVIEQATGEVTAHRNSDCLSGAQEDVFVSSDATTISWECDGKAAVWRPRSDQYAMLSLAPCSSILALSPDGRKLALECGAEIKVIDATDGHPLVRITPTLGVASATFDHASRSLALVGLPGDNVEMWDAVTGRRRGVLATRTAMPNIESVRFGPGNALIVTGSGDPHSACIQDSTTVFDATTLQARFAGFCGPQQVAMTPSGERLVGIGVSGRRLVRSTWSLTAQARIPIVCAVVNRNLTRDEWAALVGQEVPYHETCPLHDTTGADAAKG